MEKEFEAFFDISDTGTPDFEKYCPTSVSNSQNLSIDTWFNLCSEYANNEVRALDPQWDFSAKFEKTDPVAQFIIEKEYKTGLERTAKVKLVNYLKGTNGKQITFTCVFDDISYTFERETVVEISFSLKVHRGSTFVEADYTGA